MSDIQIPGYDILERIGRGGMATVYKARHQRLNRILALKVMSRALNSDPSFSERFIREARIVAALTHPHIIQIHDVDHYEDLNFLTMEYVPGGDLTKRLKDGIDLETAIQILTELGAALDAAHAEGPSQVGGQNDAVLKGLDGKFSGSQLLAAASLFLTVANQPTQAAPPGAKLVQEHGITPSQVSGRLAACGV